MCLDRLRKAESTSGCTSESILDRLETKALGRRLTLLDECTSTNDVGRRLAACSAIHGSLILSATQTAGRGRHGRFWVSPRGGIWMTLILRSHFTLPVEAISIIGALSTARSIRRHLRIDSRVRWPNDVVVNRSKVAGLLVEGFQKGNLLEFILLGIGVNANFESQELRNQKIEAVTLMDLKKRPIDSSTLICSILLDLEYLLALAESNPTQILHLLRENDSSRGKKIKIVTSERMIEGIFGDYQSLNSVTVDLNGELIVVPIPSAIMVEYPS